MFYKNARKHQTVAQQFIDKIDALGYRRLFDLCPHVLGAVQWPYLHNEWNVETRFQTISTHYEIVSQKSRYLDASFGEMVDIVDLSAFSSNARLVIDRPSWFAREGEIALNLFKDDLRVMTLAFTLGKQDDKLVIYVGCIQGIHAGVDSDTSLDIIKKLSKEFFGERPRSLMIETLKMIAKWQGVSRILAISDAHRHHRHPYFDGYLNKLSTSNYDAIWMEHEGVASDHGFFEIPIAPHRKMLDDIPSNKRSMYRKRYAMLDYIDQQLANLK